jgi:hypothetical protein
MKFISMLARGSMNHDRSVSTIAVDLFHAESVPFQSSSGVSSTEIHV